MLWRVVTYRLSVGPVAYVTERGWISQAPAEAYARPIEVADDAAEAVGDVYQDDVNWCEDVGERHASDRCRARGNPTGNEDCADRWGISRRLRVPRE